MHHSSQLEQSDAAAFLARVARFSALNKVEYCSGFLGLSAGGHVGSSRPRLSRRLVASLALHLSVLCWAQTLIVTSVSRVCVCAGGVACYPMNSQGLHV